MKTAEELWVHYITLAEDFDTETEYPVNYIEFEHMLGKYRQSIIEMIDGMIEKMQNVKQYNPTKDYSFTNFVTRTRTQALTELKDKLSTE